MASASPVSPSETLRASSGKDNFTRLARLLICGGTRILREYFDSCHPPAILPTWLRTPAVEQNLEKLKKRRVLSLAQWKLLYPSSTTCGTSESFDITLLFTLIRELVVLTPPALGWDNLPADTDLTLPADLARIKYYRNTLAHGNENMELTGDEFDEYWEQLEGALLRIVTYYAGSTSSALKNWETAIYDLFKSPISKENGVNNLLENPQAELHMESEYFKWNSRLRHCLPSYINAAISDDRTLRSGVTNLIRTQNEGKSPKEIMVRCILKAATWGAVVAGTTYIFYRYKDDPEELRRMIRGALIPVAGILVGTVAIGSIKIGLQAESLEALEGLLIRYKSGKLEKDLAKVFMTEELKKATNGEAIEFRVEMNENDYRIAYCEMMHKAPKRKGKASSLRQLNSIDTQNDLLRERLNNWINGRRQVVKSVRDYANSLTKLQLRIKFAKATKIFDALFWPILVAAGAMLAYYLNNGSWITAAAVVTVFTTVIAILVAIFGAEAFKASLRSFCLTNLYDFSTRKRWHPGSGKHSAHASLYHYVPRQEVEEDLRVSQTMVTRREDVNTDIIGESTLVSYVWDADFQRLREVRFYLKDIKDKVKCLKEPKSQHYANESSLEFDKTFHDAEELIESLALSHQDFRPLVESLVENHQGNVSKVEKKVREMAEDLEITCRDKDKAHDFGEEYLDELFMCLCTYHDQDDNNTRTERLGENVERLYELCDELFANRREVRKELTSLADRLNKREWHVIISEAIESSPRVVGGCLVIVGIVASFFLPLPNIYSVLAFFVGIFLFNYRGIVKPMYFLSENIYQGALQSIYRGQKLTKKLRSCIKNLEVGLNSIKKDELEELGLKLVNDLTMAETSTSGQSTLGKKILYDSIQATKGVRQPFGTGARNLRECGLRGEASLAFVDIYKFAESSTLLHGGHGSVAEKKIREIVKGLSCPDREEVSLMIKEYITETLFKK